MALNINPGRGIRLPTLLLITLLVGGCKPIDILDPEPWTRGFGWDPRTSELAAILAPPASSTAAAARQAGPDDLHPIDFPAWPSASHDSPLPDYRPAETSTGERPADSLAHGQDMSSDPGDFFGTGFRNIENLDDLVARLAGGTPGSNGLAAAGASQAHSDIPHALDSHSLPDAPALLEHSFPPSSDIHSAADERAPHKRQRVGPSLPIPNHLPLKHNYLLPDYQYHPAETSTEERPADSLAHGQDMPSDPGDFFGTGFRNIENLDDLVARLAGGTPGSNGLVVAGASQAHSDIPHALDSHSHTIAGAGQSDAPALSGHTLPPHSDVTSGPKQRPSRKRNRKPNLWVKTLRSQSGRVTSQKQPQPPRSLYVPRPSKTDPGLSRKFLPQGRLVFHSNLFAPDNSSDGVQRREIGPIQLALQQLRKDVLVIPESEFTKTYQMYLGSINARESTKRGEPKIDHTGADRSKRLLDTLHEFAPHCEHWYQRWFDETGIDFKHNLLESQFDGLKDVGFIFPLYLFYVEMILSIVPRKKEVPLDVELVQAQESFNRLTKIYKDPKSRSDPKLNDIVETLRIRRARRGETKYHPLLWNYLDFWILFIKDTSQREHFNHMIK
ncbi:hypothetical protein PTTG_26724 [Puccinia triticina 1-1 BBBD Race 1]|uniref:Uncharacterized protein n=1 Tax=Puccinia triticina (isolate 1-1 / race 1 (BBBD)) TaxID=630390 RepID=A0A180GS48_PUCT1|nr:hypothetical protein PTTG_26724 [Puccinia triticina 1-1 BBBD Race 1]